MNTNNTTNEANRSNEKAAAAAAAKKAAAAAAAKKAAAAAKKAAAAAKKPSDFIACTVLNKEGKAIDPEKMLFSLSTEKPAKSIGDHCAKSAEKIVFLLNGHKVTIPAGKNMGGKERFLTAAAGIVSAIYAGKDKTDTVTEPTHMAIIEGLKGAGVKFSDFSRSAVSEAVRIQKTEFTTVSKTAILATRDIKENKISILRTDTAKKLNKEIKENGLLSALKMVEDMKANKDAGAPFAENLFSALVTSQKQIEG